MISSFITATAYLSLSLSGALTHPQSLHPKYYSTSGNDVCSNSFQTPPSHLSLVLHVHIHMHIMEALIIFAQPAEWHIFPTRKNKLQTS